MLKSQGIIVDFHKDVKAASKDKNNHFNSRLSSSQVSSKSKYVPIASQKTQ